MRRLQKSRGGIAMILVVVVMAAAAIMAFALLSSASLQAEAASNSVSSVSADGLDQSGANLEMYYLVNPDKADSTYFTTTSNTTFYNPGIHVPSMSLANGSSVSEIAAALSSRTRTLVNYAVDVTASYGTTSPLTHTQHSLVQVEQRYLPKYALATTSSFTMPLTWLTSSITGPVRCDGGYGGLASILSGLLYGTTSNPLPSYPLAACPSYSQINLAKTCSSGTYSLGTYTGNCLTISSGSLTASNFTNAGSLNAGSIFYCANDVQLNGNMTIAGTVVLANSRSLTISSGTVTITPKSGYPALIVAKDLIFKGTTNTLKVNGLCWLGGMMTGTGLLPAGTLNVNGSLMWSGTGTKIDTSKLTTTSKLIVSYPTSTGTIDPAIPDSLYVPEFSDVDQTPKNVKVLSTSVN